jgi:hypothetical protein
MKELTMWRTEYLIYVLGTRTYYCLVFRYVTPIYTYMYSYLAAATLLRIAYAHVPKPVRFSSQPETNVPIYYDAYSHCYATFPQHKSSTTGDPLLGNGSVYARSGQQKTVFSVVSAQGGYKKC